MQTQGECLLYEMGVSPDAETAESLSDEMGMRPGCRRGTCRTLDVEAKGEAWVQTRGECLPDGMGLDPGTETAECLSDEMGMKPGCRHSINAYWQKWG